MERKSNIKIVLDDSTTANSLTEAILKNAQKLNIEIIKKSDSVKYNNNQLLLLSNQKGFIRACPCSRNYRCCNYFTIDTIEGCIFDCEYCILKTFIDPAFILIKTDIDSLRDEISSFYQKISDKNLTIRIGTGELSDSLALEDIAPYAPILIEEFRGKNNLILEFKTKSDKIDTILNLPHNPLTTVSFSITTDYLQKLIEKGTSPIEKRIETAKTLVKNNYRVGFHFDPIIFYNGYEKDYEKTICSIAKNISVDAISWISFGTLRFGKILIDRFESPFLFSEYINDMEGKYRYPISIRKHIYQTLKNIVDSYFGNNIRVYLCMELDSLNKSIIGRKFNTDLEVNNYIVGIN